MKIRKISAVAASARQVPALLDSHGIGLQSIGCVNWDAYPYKPSVLFRIAHTGASILLHYKVTESSVRAKYAEDNSTVCKDSCVEFFFMPTHDGIYYNIECNCAGVLKIWFPKVSGSESANSLGNPLKQLVRFSRNR